MLEYNWFHTYKIEQEWNFLSKWKKKRFSRAGDVAQKKHLPDVHEALNSVPSASVQQKDSLQKVSTETYIWVKIIMKYK